MTEQDIIIAGLFLLAALLYSSVGHAGASGYLAVMGLMGVAAGVMKPTALVLNIIVASVAAVQFYRAGCFSWRLFWPFAVTSIPAAFVGGAITLPAAYYKPVVGAILLVAAVRMVWTAARSDTQPAHPPPLWVALLTGAALGLLSGLTGTGGGIFLSPLLLIAGWAKTRETSGVSAVFILVNSIAGLLGAVASLRSLPPAIPLWGAAALAGGLTGSYFGSKRIPSPWLRRLLAAVLVVAGLKLLLRF